MLHLQLESKQAHQIDVYWELNVAGVLHRVAVECKEYANSVSIGKIRDFYGPLEDIGNINGIFVTTKGYQSGAVTFAEHKGISLKVVKEPTQHDLDEHQGIKTVCLSINAKCIDNIKMTPLLDVQWVLDETEINEGDELLFFGRNDEVKVLDSNFNLLGTILDFENKLPREPQNRQGLTHTYEFEDAFMHIPNSGYPPLKLKGINFEYDSNTVSSTSEITFKLIAEAVIKDVLTGESHLYNKQVDK